MPNCRSFGILIYAEVFTIIKKVSNSSIFKSINTEGATGVYYPIKLKPAYKDYVWGGRYFENFKRELPEGPIAESWELSCHKNGVSVAANGVLSGKTLTEIVSNDKYNILGTLFPMDMDEIPLLIKFIDANDKLSVQVHPDDSYAFEHEGGRGKNEMWYVYDAKPGARLVAGLKQGVGKEEFILAVKENRIEECLIEVEVQPGDVINVPAGLLHSIGAGTVIVEIQQTSDITYRVFDYNRVDSNGVGRPLHIDKALSVVNFDSKPGKVKIGGIPIKVNPTFTKTIYVANKFFACEKYQVNGRITEATDNSRFYAYVCLEGRGRIISKKMAVSFCAGETVLIPAALGKYDMEGEFASLKAYVPDFMKDIIEPMKKAGCTEDEINQLLGL